MPPFRIPTGARRDRVTGSQVYGFVKCEHSVWLDFHGDPAERLPHSAAVERLLEHGRDHEDQIVGTLDYREPAYPVGKFAEGADQTRGLLEEGVLGVSQGVLFEPPFLGIPDLLRRVDGASDLGDWHYVVGDVKSSWRPRSDQALQVSFYSELLGRLQGREPPYGFLILRDGSEERFSVADLRPVLKEVLSELDELLAGESRPHHSWACRECGWRDTCSSDPDVHWIPGLTRSEKRLIAAMGLGGLAQLAAVHTDDRKMEGSIVSEATLERARAGARALIDREAVRVRPPRVPDLMHPLQAGVAYRDGFDRRLLVLARRSLGGTTVVHRIERAEDEDAAVLAFAGELAEGGTVLHSGSLVRAIRERAIDRPETWGRLEALDLRALDLMGLVRGAWVFPAPVSLPTDALAWFEGRAPATEDRLALYADERDFAGLEELARSELDALDQLADRVVGVPQ